MQHEIGNEARQLLASGLRDILEKYGEVHVVGSYTLDLMVWRDLDIHVVRESIKVSEFFNESNRAAILRIKSACWQHPEYRRSI